MLKVKLIDIFLILHLMIFNQFDLPSADFNTQTSNDLQSANDYFLNKVTQNLSRELKNKSKT